MSYLKFREEICFADPWTRPDEGKYASYVHYPQKSVDQQMSHKLKKEILRTKVDPTVQLVPHMEFLTTSRSKQQDRVEIGSVQENKS